jgi:coenzyme F420-reducing hydrogenase gamma subunit
MVRFACADGRCAAAGNAQAYRKENYERNQTEHAHDV